MKKITYAQFAEYTLQLIQGATLENEVLEAMSAKANDLMERESKKAEYSRTHKSPSKAPKGASAQTLQRAQELTALLTTEPQTSAELTPQTQENLSALQLATVMKYVEGVKVTKKVVSVTNSKGLVSEKEQTAYSL